MKVLSSVFALLVTTMFQSGSGSAWLPHWYKEVIKPVARDAVNVDGK